MTCAQKEALLDQNSYQIFRLNKNYGICEDHANDSVSCRSISYKFQSARERWWFMAISHCLFQEGLYLEYDVYMRNGEPGDFFREHFSADELYILEFNIAFFFIGAVMLAFVVAVSVRLAAKQMFHSTYKIFLASVVLFDASIVFTCVAYMIQATSGLDNWGLKSSATLLYAASQVLLILMLLLLGLGYTVVCGRLPHWGVICLSVFISSFALTYIALYIVEAATFDPALVLYRWESAPGYGLMALILAAWLFYLGCCIFTIAKHKQKVAFYVPMLVFYTFWFIAIPVTVGINMQYVEDYARAKVVNFVEVITLFLSHVFYLVLTWPSLANKNFPFHIKTTQIDVITFEAANRLAEEEENRNTDLADGGQFTDFSIFTVPDQRARFAVATPATASGAVGRRAGFGAFGETDFDLGTGTGGVNGDSDSGVASISRGAPSAAATIAASGGDADADSIGSPGSSGSNSGAARLIEAAAFAAPERDGGDTEERPVAPEAAPAADELDDGDSLFPLPAAETSEPRWPSGSGGGRLPPI